MRNDTREKIKEFKVKTFGSAKMIERAEKLLKNDEEVLYINCANVVTTDLSTKKSGRLAMVIILTPQRIIFYNKALMDETIEYVELSTINSFGVQTDSLYGYINIQTVTRSYQIVVTRDAGVLQKTQYIFTEASKKLQGNLLFNISELSQADEIKKFKDLFEQGIISQEEFEAKKKQLLDL